MGAHLASSVERLIRRVGKPVTVCRKVGALDPVTSKRPSVVELRVDTLGMLRRSTQRSAKGDPLSTEETYYLVPARAFADSFIPRDSDLVLDGTNESRVLSVRTREVSGQDLAYELYVSGVAL